ncbi:MAG: 3-hydroxybutyryl-CoA dehydrogenase [Bordetella sp.]|nr:3-hydroxybutyryl-CoA dehydrogenase [Bordetella sp.]
MSAPLACIAVVGVGRMGVGIAVSYAYAGMPVALVDAKPRDAAAQQACFDGVRQALRAEFDTLAALGLLPAERVDAMLARVSLHARQAAAPALQAAPLVFEAVPERLDAKREVFGWIGGQAGPDCVLASTTSTFLVTQLAAHAPDATRFLNAHWLNPAHLIPLVEVSPGPDTSAAALARVETLLRQARKVPVRCAPSAGYIVPRIQALAMNEAARMVEEGVASAEDIDTAVRLGFGLRFSVLGLLEFIDWGGNDILYYASRYLDGALGPRFQAPAVIERNMEQGRNGLRDGQGFYDYAGRDIGAYRLQRLGELVRRLEVMDLLPRVDGARPAG